MEIDAEAEAEQTRRIAKGEADGVLFRKQAEAQGLYEILTKQAEGYKEVVSAADYCVEIPQKGTKHSLNISVSCGVVLWDLFSKLN